MTKKKIKLDDDILIEHVIYNNLEFWRNFMIGKESAIELEIAIEDTKYVMFYV